MDKEKDYDLVIGKVPRKDKNGNDITGDRLGTGGRRREDSTYSGVAYDLEIIDEQKPSEKPSSIKASPKKYEEFSPGGQLIIDVTDMIVTKTAEYLTDKAITSFEKWLEERRIKNSKKNKKVSNYKKKSISQPNRKQNKETCSIKTSIDKSKSFSVTEDFDNAYEQFKINMTSEEAQKELLDIFILSVIRAQKVWKLSHANIVNKNDFSTEIISGEEMINRLSESSVISNINKMLETNPFLLDEWESIVLTDILGRDMVEDDKYIAIEDTKFREALLKKQSINAKR